MLNADIPAELAWTDMTDQVSSMFTLRCTQRLVCKLTPHRIAAGNSRYKRAITSGALSPREAGRDVARAVAVHDGEIVERTRRSATFDRGRGRGHGRSWYRSDPEENVLHQLGGRFPRADVPEGEGATPKWLGVRWRDALRKKVAVSRGTTGLRTELPPAPTRGKRDIPTAASVETRCL